MIHFSCGQVRPEQRCTRRRRQSHHDSAPMASCAAPPSPLSEERGADVGFYAEAATDARPRSRGAVPLQRDEKDAIAWHLARICELRLGAGVSSAYKTSSEHGKNVSYEYGGGIGPPNRVVSSAIRHERAGTQLRRCSNTDSRGVEGDNTGIIGGIALGVYSGAAASTVDARECAAAASEASRHERAGARRRRCSSIDSRGEEGDNTGVIGGDIGDIGDVGGVGIAADAAKSLLRHHDVARRIAAPQSAQLQRVCTGVCNSLETSRCAQSSAKVLASPGAKRRLGVAH
jgi:hypothetical protein